MFFLFLASILFVPRLNTSFENSYKRETYEELSVSGGVVPHHLLAEDVIDSFFQYLSELNIENIVILSPDHFDASVLTGNSFIGVDYEDETFLDCPINETILDSINKLNLALNINAVSSDHGVSNLIPYIRKYLPESRVLPLLISPRTTSEEMDELIQIINENSVNTVVIASVDFSHYLPREVAEFHDIKSISALIEFRENDFPSLEVDCWQALYGARLFSKLRKMEKYYIVGKGGSWDYMDDELDEKGDETTSYFSVVFQNTGQQSEMEKEETILFTGGIVFDDNLEELINQNSALYPFEKIERFLRGVNVVVGNLEGTIVYESSDFTDNTANFHLLPEITGGLFWSHFNLLSLGGDQSLSEAKEALDKWDIEYMGNPTICGKESVIEYKDIAFLSFNMIYKQNCSEAEISALVSETRASEPDSYIAVIINWDEKSNLSGLTKQRELARKIIDAGADIIVGQYAQAIQKIELYENKPIFYSLGHFIDNQYLSEEQEGLVVGVELYENSINYHIFPIKISQGQTILLTGIEKTDFLKTLASKNDVTLYESIESGTLNVKR